MKAVVAIACLLLAVVGPTSAVENVVAAKSAISPVTRVVQLLSGLSKKIEEEGKIEEKLYNQFVCWGNRVISEKTASNQAAEAEITELETYVSDLEAGRIELTDERVTLEAEIKGLTDEIESMEALRKKENEEFLAAEDEMTKAIDALAEAMKVLAEATKDHKEGVLLSIRKRLGGGMAALEEHSARLDRAADMCDKFLSQADARFLRRLLTGDVPTWDWKKLNRKATFKMNYKARSFKIQQVLAKMHQTFSINLQEAQTKEQAAQAEFETLHKAKSDELDAAKLAREKMVEETGARSLSKADAQAKIADLKTQVQNDEKFIKDTQESLDIKKEEWKHRIELRRGELAAISKAIYILHNDDARDLFKKSLESQGYSLLQVDMKAEQSREQAKALATLRRAAAASGDERLLELIELKATNTSVKGAFEPIINAIDNMTATLREEEQSDLETKEACEKQRMEDTRKAILDSRSIDEMSAEIARLKEEIRKLEVEIEEMEARQEEIKTEVAKATEIREKENTEWQANDKDDEEAAKLVVSARDVLAKFYEENQLALGKLNLMQHSHREPEKSGAGLPPPPPPTTWDAPYGGAGAATESIVVALDLIKEDIEKDRATALAAEKEAEKKYQAFKTESEEELKELGEQIAENEEQKGKKEEAIGQIKDDRGIKKGELDVVIKKIKDAEAECDYFTINYALRAKNRHVELDGLLKARAILLGAQFSDQPDPNRELKPGDAAVLLQNVGSLRGSIVRRH